MQKSNTRDKKKKGIQGKLTSVRVDVIFLSCFYNSVQLIQMKYNKNSNFKFENKEWKESSYALNGTCPL